MATDGNQELSRTQHKALAALMTQRDVKHAATAAGVGERTLHTWLRQPAFKAALRDLEADAIDTATRRLTTLADSAVTVLAWVLANPETHAGTRLRAATGILDQLLRLRELRGLEERITALEERIGGGQ